MKIAISGKGGTGKTTIAAGIIRYLARQEYQVYAVDADPDTSLGIALRLPQEKLGNLKPIVDMREIISKKTGGNGALFSLNPDVDSMLDKYTVRNDNILFLKMGAVKQGGSSCYCRENSVLNAMINSILLKQQEIVVLDMGAGIEHLTRGTSRGVDVMLIITEPSTASIQTALVVKKLASELGIQNVKFVGNKIRRERDRELIIDSLPAFDVLGFVPFQSEIMDYAAGFSDDDNYLPESIEDLASKLRVFMNLQ